MELRKQCRKIIQIVPKGRHSYKKKVLMAGELIQVMKYALYTTRSSSQISHSTNHIQAAKQGRINKNKNKCRRVACLTRGLSMDLSDKDCCFSNSRLDFLPESGF